MAGRQFFCWHCGQATGQAHTYSNISDHSCGRYKEEADRRIDEAQRNHKRYMHYFERWKGHVDSLVKERTNRWGRDWGGRKGRERPVMGQEGGRGGSDLLWAMPVMGHAIHMHVFPCTLVPSVTPISIIPTRTLSVPVRPC